MKSILKPQDSPTSSVWSLVVVLYCSIFLICAAGPLFASEVIELQKLVHPNAALKDQFGYAVAVSGNTIAVGRPSGSLVYIFERDAGTMQWSFVKQLFMPIGWYGGSVALDGDTLVVGATYDLGQRGSAHVYERNHGGSDNWGLVKSIIPEWGTFEFGKSVGVSGDTIVVSQMGGLYRPTFVYERDAGGAEQWGQVATLYPVGDTQSRFGYSVAIDGDTIIVGAVTDSENGVASGTAYVYGRNAGGPSAWGLLKKLAPSDGAQWDDFGESVAVCGDFILVGANQDDDKGNDSGSAYLFERNAGGAENWGQVGKLLAADGSYQDGFGHSVWISDSHIVVGAWRDDATGFDSGSAYLFRLDPFSADKATQLAKIVPSDGSALLLFGWRVAIAGDLIVVGAPVEVASGNPEHTGYAYIYAIADSELYEQLPGHEVYGPAGVRAADNFTLPQNATIQKVRWWGGCSSTAGGPRPITDLSSLTVEFFAADGVEGEPGTCVYAESFSSAAANPQPTGMVNEYSGVELYVLEVNLTSPLALPADTPYWISISGATIDPSTHLWWASTAPGTYDGVGMFYDPINLAWDSSNGSSCIAAEHDMAFALLDGNQYHQSTPTTLDIQLDDGYISWWVQHDTDEDQLDSTRSNEWPFCDSGAHVPIELGNSSAVLRRVSAFRVNGGARFDYNTEVTLGNEDQSAGTDGYFNFTLGEHVYYKVSGLRQWTGTTLEYLSDYFSLVSLTTGDTIYEESEESVATSAIHRFNMIADGPMSNLAGANTGELPPGQYSVSFHNAVIDDNGEGIRDGLNDMKGETSVNLLLSKSPFPDEPANAAPLADAGSDVITQCQGPLTAVQLDGTASSDPDGDLLTFTWSLPANSAATLDDSSRPATTGSFPLGITVVVLTVTDPSGASSTDEVSVTVTDTTPPVVQLLGSTLQLVPCGTPYIEMGAVANDQCDGDLTSSIIVDASAVDTSVSGFYEVTYNVTDLSGNAASQVSRAVQVSSCNQPPSIEGGGPDGALSATVNEDGLLTQTLATDADGDPLTVTVVSGPTHGSALFSGAVIAYAPEVNFNGIDVIAFTVSDGKGGEASGSLTITVLPVNDPPIAACHGADAIAGPDCTASVTLDGSASSDPDGDSLTFVWTGPFGNASGPSPTVILSAGTHTIHLTVDDGHGATSVATTTVNVDDQLAPDLDLHSPASGLVAAVDSPILFQASIAEACELDLSSLSWRFQVFGHEPIVDPIPAESVHYDEENSLFVVSEFVAFSEAGIYSVALTAADAAGNSSSQTTISVDEEQFPAFVVIYDPDGGFVTGGGWINSPPEAYRPDPALTGKATFGFNSKYKKGANVPTGQTEFQFKVANLNFHSESYEWMVVAGAKAQYKGEGTINGGGAYKFMLTAIDGQAAGGGGVDKFRMRIWDKINGGLVYDNQLNAPDDADPTTQIQGGSIVIHKNKN